MRLWREKIDFQAHSSLRWPHSDIALGHKRDDEQNEKNSISTSRKRRLTVTVKKLFQCKCNLRCGDFFLLVVTAGNRSLARELFSRSLQSTLRAVESPQTKLAIIIANFSLSLVGDLNNCSNLLCNQVDDKWVQSQGWMFHTVESFLAFVPEGMSGAWFWFEVLLAGIKEIFFYSTSECWRKVKLSRGWKSMNRLNREFELFWPLQFPGWGLLM